MGKGKSKQYGYDIVDNDEQAEVTLQDFVIPAKIEAFCSQYKSLDHWVDGCDGAGAKAISHGLSPIAVVGDGDSLPISVRDTLGDRRI